MNQVSRSASAKSPAPKVDLIDEARYSAMYQASISDPDRFWSEQAKRIDWIKPFTKVKNTSFAYPDVSIKWFEDGTLNVSVNCVDRHLKMRGDQVAIIWEPDDPKAEAPSRGKHLR
jgi:acetyl-CoA synthetase